MEGGVQSPQPQQSQQSKSSGKNSAKANRSGRGQRREPKYQRNENLAAEIFSMNYAHEEELYGRGSGTSGYSSQRNGSGSRNRGGNRSNKARFRSYSISKSEYVQANFRFVISPFTKPTSASLLEPDVPIAWSDVVQVILIVPPEKSFATELLTCPICLGEAQVPRITSCGHIFCCSCIRRHQSGEGINSLKCPVCTTSLGGPTELKCIRIKYSQLPVGVSSFVAPAVSNRSRGGRGNHGNARKTSNSSSQHYNRKRSESTTSETSLGVDSTSSGCRIDGNPTAAELFQEGQLFLPFTLLEIARGTIYPTLPNSYGDGDAGQGQVSHASGAQRKKASAALTLKDIVPAVDAPHAAFCQTVRATTAMMRQLFVQERCALLVFRQECRPAADVVTDVVEESKAAPRQREAVEARAGAIEDAAQTPAQQRRWASLLSNQSNSAAVESPTSSVATQQQGSAAVMAHIYGDVEALPFIDQELQSINDREKAFEQQLKQSPSDESIDREQSAAPESTESDDHQNVRYAKDDCSYLYQHAAAEMLFMHPVCSKCLLDAAASTSAPNVVTNSSPPALDMNKHGVKLTAEQPASQSDITSTFAAEQQQQHHREPRTEAFTSLATSDGVEAMDSTNATQLNSAQQSNDGVSPLAVRLLPPSNLHCRIIEVETHRVTAEFRQRYPVFRHLPLHCEILLAEVDVKNLVPPHVYERFHEEIAKRAARRKSREQQKRREQKLDQDRRLAESLAVQDRLDYAKLLQEKEAQDILDWVNGPSLGIVALESSSDINSSWPDATVGSAAIGSTAELAAEGGGQAVPSQSKTQKGAWGKGSSFANITQMGGHFPTLGASVPARAAASASSRASQPNTEGERATAAGVAYAGVSTAAGDTQGAAANNSSSDTVPASPVATGTTGSSSSTGKKSKKVPLFSTSSMRSYH